jgi:hypothetical protein
VYLDTGVTAGQRVAATSPVSWHYCGQIDAYLYAPREAGLTVGLFSTTGFTDDLAAEAAAGRGKILLLTLDELYGQSS